MLLNAMKDAMSIRSGAHLESERVLSLKQGWHMVMEMDKNGLTGKCCVLQRVAACCGAMESVAVCCSTLQCVVVCCSVLQCVAVCCSVLQCDAVCCSVLRCLAVCCSGTR